MQHKGWTMAFKVICYFYFPSIIKKIISALVRVQSVESLQLEVHSESISIFKPRPQSSQTALSQWLRNGLSILSMCDLSNRQFLLRSSTLSWSRHCPIDITMKAVPAYSWFLFPFLFWILKPHHTLKTFLCSILLSLTFIFHGNPSQKLSVLLIHIRICVPVTQLTHTKNGF